MVKYVLIVWLFGFNSAGELGRVKSESEFDTKRDCETASGIIGDFDGVESANCYTVSITKEKVKG